MLPNFQGIPSRTNNVYHQALIIEIECTRNTISEKEKRQLHELRDDYGFLTRLAQKNKGVQQYYLPEIRVLLVPSQNRLRNLGACFFKLRRLCRFPLASLG